MVYPEGSYVLQNSTEHPHVYMDGTMVSAVMCITVSVVEVLILLGLNKPTLVNVTVDSHGEHQNRESGLGLSNIH